MHELIILLPARSRLEQHAQMRTVLARATRLADGHEGEMACADYLHVANGALPAGAITREQLQHDAGDYIWVCADPAHVSPDINGARMLACGNLDLTAAEADTLLDPLNALVQDDGMRLFASTPARWHLRLPADTPVPTLIPASQVLGDDLTPHLPAGDAGRPWRKLFTEFQVLLHQAPLNQARIEQDKPSVNSVWLWGAGRLQTPVAEGVKTAFIDAPWPRALLVAAAVEVQPVAAFAQASDGAYKASSLLDLGATSSMATIYDVLARAYRQRRAQALLLHLADGERYRLSVPPKWQWWRKLA